MREIPIIFSGAMVRALLDGRKTMTRRLANYPSGLPNPWQRVKRGDLLWVRENIKLVSQGPGKLVGFIYAADEKPEVKFFSPEKHKLKSIGITPCIHMPRWASRITLQVTATHIERVQSISERAAKAEGFQKRPEISADPEVHRDAARDWFSDLWESLHGVESWQANPAVVAISFTVFKDADQSRKQETLSAQLEGDLASHSQASAPALRMRRRMRP